MAALGPAVPLLRIFDDAKARGFYVDFLGFAIEFEHRFGDDFPLYLGLIRDGCRLHLTEHSGDCCPGAHVRIAVADIDGFLAALAAKADRWCKPGSASETPWGTREATLTDPFGNRLTFWQVRR